MEWRLQIRHILFTIKKRLCTLQIIVPNICIVRNFSSSIQYRVGAKSINFAFSALHKCIVLSEPILSRNIYFDMICQSRNAPFVKKGTVTQYLFRQSSLRAPTQQSHTERKTKRVFSVWQLRDVRGPPLNP